MKLQNMTVIFIIIMIPIIIVTSYYIGLQIKTITMQKDYTVKLQTAAKDSIQALEINTVEWNSASSNLADSKRRDVLASINTFTTSLANNMGIGGAGKGRIQTYIPAIVYTMYDGYYIYSASLMKDQDTTSEGLTQFENDGTIKSNGTSYQYILKPYSPYSARYVNGNIDVTVNYTLDNYIRVYGKVGIGDEDKSVAKEGYLVVCDSNSNEGVKGVTSGSISGIEYRGAVIKPETLKENVYANGEVNGEVKEYPYIYDQYDNKLYWDGSNYFSVDKYNNKVYLQEALPEGDAGFSITNRFRKISIPMYDNREDEWTVQKVFQILNPGGGYKFYYENQSGAFVEFTSVENIDGSDNKKLAGVEVEKDKDFSAMNYCVESYVFTKWVTKNLGSITVGDMKSPTVGQYNNVDKDASIFEISKDNNPDPENDITYAESALAQHKKDIIINTIEKNLSQATAQAQEMNPNYEYRLPQLSYDEWEQALSNISIIAFMQGMPIGLKYYNNYAIATSTLNKEFVDPDELYFAGKDDQYYHQRQCEQATGSDYVGYRSIDYVAKSYEKSDKGTTSTKYYYPHANSTNSELECYYCLVNRSTYNANDKAKKWNKTPYNSWTDSYYNALARERYMQLDEPGTYKPNVTITKTADKTYIKYGEEITYTIKITNNGIVDDQVILRDDLANGKLTFIKIKENNLGTDIDNMEGKTHLQVSSPITVPAKSSVTLEYIAKPSATAKLGEQIKNTVIVYSYVNKTYEYDDDYAETQVEKEVTIAPITNSEKYNIIMILDHSNSMNKTMMTRMYLAVAGLLTDGSGLLADGPGPLYMLYAKQGIEMNLTIIHFNKKAGYKGEDISKTEDLSGLYQYYSDPKIFDTNTTIFDAGTNYLGAFDKAKEKLKNDANNVIIFLTDGCPTTEAAVATEYRIELETDPEKKDKYKYFKRTWPVKSWSNIDHTTILGFNNPSWTTAETLWSAIKKSADTIKSNNTEIYCISYGEKAAEYGLTTFISSGDSYYSYADTSDIETKFSNIIGNIKPLEINTKPIYSQNGILTIEKPDQLKYIEVNGQRIEPGNLERKIENGKLDLTQFDIGATIVLVY